MNSFFTSLAILGKDATQMEIGMDALVGYLVTAEFTSGDFS